MDGGDKPGHDDDSPTNEGENSISGSSPSAVARAHSIRKAAEHLNVTASAVKPSG